MELVKVCRICLVMGVKMHDLQKYPWDTYWEPVFEMNPLTTSDLPPFACYECAILLKKNYQFREKCLLGQTILYSILQTNGKITTDLIKEINRKDMNLVSNLQPHVVVENSIINISHEEPLIVEVKDEPKDIENIYDALDNYKQEDDLNEFPLDLPTSRLSSDDDEPLSVHKSNKQKKVKVKKKSKKAKKEQHNRDLKPKVEKTTDLLEMTTEDVLSEVLETPTKRKPGRPRKKPVEADTSASERKIRRTKNTGGVAIGEEFDLEKFVTIITLTEEEQREEITKRQHSSNYLNALFQCNLCYKGFIDTHAWEHHVGKHDPSRGDVQCPICKFRYKSRRDLQKHASNHEKKYACKSCNHVSKTTTQAKQHQRWHEGVTYQCQHCEEVFSKWTSYLSHVRMKHPSEFICGVCGYSFVSELGLNMHKTMMHKDVTSLVDSETPVNVEGPYCKECDVKFINEEAYKRHMVTSIKHIHNDDFKSGCRVCGQSFKSVEELRLHHRKEHARKRPKNYGKKPSHTTFPAHCEHCPEVISNARDYWTHFRRAHPDQNYPIQKDHVCDICGKSFRGNAFLVYHRRTHFGERNFKCAQCPKAFFNRTNLQMHEKTHSDNRPYPCVICMKAFKCKGALDRHFRSHTGAKPYECEVCGKAFGQSNSRKIHLKTVHLKQPAPYVSRARLQRKKTNPQQSTPPDIYLLHMLS